MTTSTPLILLWCVFPIVVLGASTVIVNKSGLDNKYGIKAPDIATLFLLLGINYLSLETFGSSFLPYALLIVLLVAILIAVFQAYQYREIKYKRYFKMVWRVVFLITLLIYILLIITSIITLLG